MARLGQTTADLHVALASGTGDFAAEPIQAADVASVAASDPSPRSSRPSTRWLDATSRSIRAALLRRADGIAGLLEGARRPATTATTTWARCSNATTARSSSSTSKASRPGRWRSGARNARRCAMWRACCARSTTRATRRCARATPRRSGRIRRASAWYDSAREAFLTTYLAAVAPRLADAPAAGRRGAAGRAGARKGGLRGAVRAEQSA